MEVFIEIVILDNLFFDYCLIRLTSLLWLPRPKTWRMAAAAALGTAYAVLAPIKPFIFLQTFAPKCLMSALMVFMVYGKLHPFDFAKRLASFWLAAALMAGALYAVGGLFFDVHHSGGLLFISGPPLYALLFIGAAVVVGVKRAFHTLMRCIDARATHAKLLVRVGRRSVTLSALVDTGSTLHDPVSGLPVVLLPREQIERLYPNGTPAALETQDIFFHTVTGAGSVRALPADEIWIYHAGAKQRIEALVAPAVAQMAQPVAIIPSHATLAF